MNTDDEIVYRPESIPCGLREQVAVLHALPDSPDHTALPPKYLFLTPSVELVPIRDTPLNLRGMDRFGPEWLDEFEAMLTTRFRENLQKDGSYEFVYRANRHDGLYSLEKKAYPDKGVYYLLTRKVYKPVSIHF